MSNELILFLKEKNFLEDTGIKDIPIEKINSMGSERVESYIGKLTDMCDIVSAKLDYLNLVLSSLNAFVDESFSGISTIIDIETMKAISILGKNGNESKEVEWMNVVDIGDFSYSEINNGWVFK